jgi:hypothetical protein
MSLKSVAAGTNHGHEVEFRVDVFLHCLAPL